MSDDEDDYLSDKFLFANDPSSSSSASASTKKPKTYSELRKEALRASELKNAAARKKSQRERVEEGLSTSLFDRAREEEESGRGSNKALGMMMRMGFKPGMALGAGNKSAGEESGNIPEASAGAGMSTAPVHVDKPAVLSSRHEGDTLPGHRVEPIAVSIWEGRVGIGQKRSSSKANPYAPAAKRLKTDNDAESTKAKEKESAEAFRERTRREYENKRAEARLIAATRTCVSLDEKQGIKFNILWLNPLNPNSCPPELLEAFAQEAAAEDDGDDARDPADLLDPAHAPDQPLDEDDEPTAKRSRERSSRHDRDVDNASHAARLRDQMRKDALQPSLASEDLGDDLVGPRPFGRSRKFDELDDEDVSKEADTLEFSKDEVAEAREFVSLPAKDRLERLLKYLREKYAYCFWCGTQYGDKADMDSSCPGDDEDSHD